MAGRVDVAALHQNELPYRPGEALVTEVARSIVHAHRYPSRQAEPLRRALAQRFRVPPSWVVAASGSISVIQQAMLVAGPGELVLPWPSFDAFPPLAEALRMRVRLAGLTDDGACDLGELRGLINDATRMVMVCTPNTPTGGVVTHRALTEFLAAVPERVLVLIDQAYAEFATTDDPPRPRDLVLQHPRALVTRTFSKAYGLAGMRVGYGIAQPPLAEAIIRTGVPYALTAGAEAAALVALDDQERLRANVRRVNLERTRLVTGLRALGVEVVDGHGNFVWLPMVEQAIALGERLAEAALLVKAYPGYGVRITVGTRAQVNRLFASWPALARLAAAP